MLFHMRVAPPDVFQMVSLVVWFCTAASAPAESVSLTPVEDATISENSPDLPLGTNGTTAAVTLGSGTTGPNEGLKNNRALLRFNFAASIPSNALVTSAALKLAIVATPPTSTNLWFSLHKVLPAWSESAVTWTNRLSPPAPWSVPGGAAALDYVSAVSQSNLITGVGSFTFSNSPAMAADVQGWVSNPNDNSGWILICELEGLSRSVRKFGSRETSAVTNRPTLEVEFGFPPPPLAITLLPPASGVFQFLFNAESNRNYVIEFCGGFPSTNWLVLTNVSPLPIPASVHVSDPLPDGSNRFYRIWTP